MNTDDKLKAALAKERDEALRRLAALIGGPEWYRASDLRAELNTLAAERDELRAAVSDPAAVRVNLLRGTIARPADVHFEFDEHGLIAGLRRELGELRAAYELLRAKNGRQRTELRRLNKTLRAIWEGVRFSHRVSREMQDAAAARRAAAAASEEAEK